MHDLSGGLLLGYHGCDAAVGRRLLDGENFQTSANSWDWLGHGIYFWEANPRRGYEFAKELKARNYKHNKIQTPFVIGAVLNPGLCLDMTTQAGIEIVRDSHLQVSTMYEIAGKTLPQNKPDLLKRDLDCLIVQWVHAVRDEADEPPIDSVRGVFVEGSAIYPDSGFYDRTHIQIAIRNPNCIKGVFRVPSELYE